MKNTYVYTLMILYGNCFFSVKVGIMGPGRAEGTKIMVIGHIQTKLGLSYDWGSLVGQGQGQLYTGATLATNYTRSKEFYFAQQTVRSCVS